MIHTVTNYTAARPDSHVKFWFVKNFLSPQFKRFLPHMAAKWNFSFEVGFTSVHKPTATTYSVTILCFEMRNNEALRVAAFSISYQWQELPLHFLFAYLFPATTAGDVQMAEVATAADRKAAHDLAQAAVGTGHHPPPTVGLPLGPWGVHCRWTRTRAGSS